MKTTNTLRVSQLALLLAGVAVVGGCNDKSMDPVANNPMPPPTVAPTVPNSAGASSAAFVAYLKTLPATDETSEPLLINNDFASPAEDTAEPIAL